MIDLSKYDPMALPPDGDNAFGKTVRHVLENGDRVVVNSPGHHTHGHAGAVIDSRHDNRIEVALDSGHMIHVHVGDLIPEGLAHGGESAIESDKVLQRAIAAGRVTPHDQAQIESARAKIAKGQYAVSPFALDDELPHDSPFLLLKFYREKYASGSDEFAKRASSPFHVGQTIATKNGRRTGTIKAILSSGLLEIQFGASLSGLYTPDSVEEQAA